MIKAKTRREVSEAVRGWLVWATKNDKRFTDQMRRIRVPKIPKLLGQSTKVEKGVKKKVKTAILYLAPADLSGRDLCPSRTDECTAVCLGHSAGRLIYDSSRNSQIWKTALFLYNRALFNELLELEIAALERSAKKSGFVPAVRLNGTSDCVPSWKFAERFPEVQFYDYTKRESLVRWVYMKKYIPNFHLTLSFSGDNWAECERYLNSGGTVAAVFAPRLPDSFMGFPVIDGDETDVRFYDPAGSIVGLSFKGHKIQSAGRFLIRVSD